MKTRSRPGPQRGYFSDLRQQLEMPTERRDERYVRTLMGMRPAATLVLTVLIFACSRQTEMVAERPAVTPVPWRISGYVTLASKAMLPGEAVVMVGLFDISANSGVGAPIVGASQVIKHVRRFPVSYALQVNPLKITTNHRYALRALVGGRTGPQYVSNNQPIHLTADSERVNIQVLPIALWAKEHHIKN
jgi:uncharacterized lipoprotein YbaY